MDPDYALYLLYYMEMSCNAWYNITMKMCTYISRNDVGRRRPRCDTSPMEGNGYRRLHYKRPQRRGGRLQAFIAE